MDLIGTLEELGNIDDNYLEDATSAWDATTHHAYTVPAGERWLLFGGVINRDANATLDVTVQNAAGKTILYLSDQAAGTGITHYPDSSVGGDQIIRPIPLDAGMVVYILTGAAQGAGAYSSCFIIRVGV